MSEASISSSTSEKEVFPSKPAMKSSGLLFNNSILRRFASLKFTVTLLILSIFLVYSGTLVQVDLGIWTVIDKHFRCYFAWIQVKTFFPPGWSIPAWIQFPFPGGKTLGILLLINILSAHASRFKITAKGMRLYVGLLVLALSMLLTWLVIIGFFTSDLAATKDDAFWRVLYRLGKGGFAALALMVGCVLLFSKRAGIVLLHSGVILMIAGEFITGSYAEEGTMRIVEGGSSNYIRTSVRSELAIIDSSDPAYDEVRAIPERMFAEQKSIQDPDLPFTIEVLKFYKNAALEKIGNDRKKAHDLPVTTGYGLKLRAVKARVISGTDSSQMGDAPAVYLRFLNKDSSEPLGTFMFSLHRSRTAQTLEVGGKTFALYLRFMRTYKPYYIHLEEFRHDKYLGTNKPKNFSSEIRLVDAENGVDRDVKIWMNNPLRYRGETFYQSSFEGDNVTILQIVKNSGWMIPYVSCMVVALGMAVHFWNNLFAFLKKRRMA